MYLIYKILLPIIVVCLSPVVILALILTPKFRAGFFEKLGFYSYKHDKKKSTVFHAVSVGETNAIADAVKAYKTKYPDRRIVITNTTETGHGESLKKFKGIADAIVYFPFDFSFSVNSFFNCFNPEKVVIAETEIWPAFVFEADKRGIDVIIANGRISPHSYEGYMKFSFIFRQILSKYRHILMQTKADVQRIKDIGAPEDTVEFMGNLKFDITNTLSQDELNTLKNRFKADGKRIIIAGSTHTGEDEIVLGVFSRLKQEFSDVKLLIAPRHPQRFDKVYSLISNCGMSYGKVSEQKNFDDVDILLGDTMGELAKFYSICTFAFIGGSYSGTGGHNPLEANIFEKPVISGPDTFNFKDIYKILTDKNAAIIAVDENAFYEEAKSLLTDNIRYEATCRSAGEVFAENRGAVLFLINRLS